MISDKWDSSEALSFFNHLGCKEKVRRWV